jgi:hypothetical protein
MVMTPLKDQVLSGWKRGKQSKAARLLLVRVAQTQMSHKEVRGKNADRGQRPIQRRQEDMLHPQMETTGLPKREKSPDNGKNLVRRVHKVVKEKIRGVEAEKWACATAENKCGRKTRKQSKAGGLALDRVALTPSKRRCGSSMMGWLAGQKQREGIASPLKDPCLRR